jgi:hypothetical protein
MNIYYITAAGNFINSKLGSSCQGNRYGTEKAGPSFTYKITHAGTSTSNQPGGLPCWAASPQAFGLIAYDIKKAWYSFHSLFHNDFLCLDLYLHLMFIFLFHPRNFTLPLDFRFDTFFKGCEN